MPLSKVVLVLGNLCFNSKIWGKVKEAKAENAANSPPFALSKRKARGRLYTIRGALGLGNGRRKVEGLDGALEVGVLVGTITEGFGLRMPAAA